ncbi:MAG: IPT/TIG domain-containing protein, partial [Myxococcota bacterium]|nr:IPT/TIG domain-containing protein [Myxococcota bacterium]
MQVRQLAEHIFFIGAFALSSLSCVDSEPIVSGYADQAAAPALPTGTTVLEPTVGYPANLPYVVSPTVDQDEIDPLNFGVEPTVISAEPVTAAAIGGTTVTIQGANFQPGATVWFGDTAGENVFFINAGFINVDTPVSSPGVVDISIENPDGGVGTLEDAFVFTADLELDAISPSEGSVLGGETVTITGVGFDESVQVLIGGRLALAVQALDLFTLEAVTPPGTAGLQDVRVLVPGEAVAELERSFRYAGPPDIERVFPPAAPAVGGTTVVIYGKRLDSESVVTFDGKAAEVLDVDLSGQALTVRVPSGNAGPADVTVENEFGEDVLLGGFAWTQPAAALVVQHITPAAGPIAGGNTIALVLSNHVSEEPTAVLIDGQPADIFDSTVDGVVEVVVPAGIAGEVDVEVTHRGETTIATDGYRYEDIFSLSVVSPAFGDAAGGDVRVVWGTRFDLLNASDLSVQLGPLQAPAVELETTETMVTTVFETPPCSPGPNDVVVKSGAMEAVLPGGYDCIAESVALLAADPGVVAQSGGTLIRLVGTGLPAEAIVTIGGQVAPVVERESQVAIWVRAPRGEVGTAEVRIISPELKAPLILTDGVTYR